MATGSVLMFTYKICSIKISVPSTLEIATSVFNAMYNIF